MAQYGSVDQVLDHFEAKAMQDARQIAALRARLAKFETLRDAVCCMGSAPVLAPDRWRRMARVYQMPGAHHLFDTIADALEPLVV